MTYKEQVKSLIEGKICKIPHGVDRKVFYNTKSDKNNKPFVFLVQKGWRGTNWDRGGVQYCLLAFAQEFSKDENVKMTVKLNPAYINPEILNQSIAALNLPKDRAPIHICSDNLPMSKLNDMYNDADCFICATRAEAFNLPGLEAMSTGLMTIQTSYGGQVDYMTDVNSLFIDYNLSEVTEDIAYEGIQWATPKIESIRKQLRWAFENQDKIKEMGMQAEEDSKKWTWENSAKLIIKFIGGE